MTNWKTKATIASTAALQNPKILTVRLFPLGCIKDLCACVHDPYLVQCCWLMVSAWASGSSLLDMVVETEVVPLTGRSPALKVPLAAVPWITGLALGVGYGNIGGVLSNSFFTSYFHSPSDFVLEAFGAAVQIGSKLGIDHPAIAPMVLCMLLVTIDSMPRILRSPYFFAYCMLLVTFTEHARNSAVSILLCVNLGVRTREKLEKLTALLVPGPFERPVPRNEAGSSASAAARPSGSRDQVVC